ncbi:MAG: nucleoside triphosphate pyrophosphohydrolase [Clostridia bacterium]|nr:nucleoside triphosphate pyrophosphohydrolase [Clostridia bacterium]
MERKFFNKLVRDKIPEMLAKNGGEPETETLNDEKYKTCLYEKLKEECEETVNSYSKENLAEELADLLEVIMAISKLNDIDFAEIEKIRLAKKEKRGGFDSKILLKSSNIVNKI